MRTFIFCLLILFILWVLPLQASVQLDSVEVCELYEPDISVVEQVSAVVRERHEGEPSLYLTCSVDGSDEIQFNFLWPPKSYRGFDFFYKTLCMYQGQKQIDCNTEFFFSQLRGETEAFLVNDDIPLEQVVSLYDFVHKKNELVGKINFGGGRLETYVIREIDFKKEGVPGELEIPKDKFSVRVNISWLYSDSLILSIKSVCREDSSCEWELLHEETLNLADY